MSFIFWTYTQIKYNWQRCSGWVAEVVSIRLHSWATWWLIATGMWCYSSEIRDNRFIKCLFADNNIIYRIYNSALVALCYKRILNNKNAWEQCLMKLYPGKCQPIPFGRIKIPLKVVNNVKYLGLGKWIVSFFHCVVSNGCVINGRYEDLLQLFVILMLWTENSTLCNLVYLDFSY